MEEEISIYDGEFTWNQRNYIFEFFMNSKYTFSRIEQNHKEACMVSSFSPDDLKRLQLLENIHTQDLLDRINGRMPIHSFVNFDSMLELHHPHTHPGQEVLLYQANMEWRPEWYGETCFYEPDCKEIAFMNMYTPGRLIWFDGNIPHSARPPSSVSPFCRFTFSMVFAKEGDNESFKIHG